jgi:predicted PurR-regulated permease PerM
MSNGQAAPKGLPTEFFTAGTFGTLGGCALVTWVVTSVIAGLFKTDTAITGFIVAIIVAYVALFLSKKRSAAQAVVTFFNGFLIYLTVIGGTSFMPILNNNTASVIEDTTKSVGETLTRPWLPDRNLVKVSDNLLQISQKQDSTINEYELQVRELRTEIQNIQQLPPGTRNNLINSFKRVDSANQSLQLFNEDRYSIIRNHGIDLKK